MIQLHPRQDQHQHRSDEIRIQQFTDKIKKMLVYPASQTPSPLVVQELPVNILQELIYFFNDTKVRDYLIRHFRNKVQPQSGCQYLGTMFVREKDDDSRELMMDEEHHRDDYLKNQCFTLADVIKNKIKYLQKRNMRTLFTLAILYKVSSIHFVSFMYDPVARRLISFDPGNNLYHNGSRVLIPNCVDAFVEHGLLPHQDALTRTGPCGQYYFGRTFGPQYNGEDPDQTDLPADAFCQSWSLRFKLYCIVNKGDHSFVKEWCRIPPKNRQASMVRDFFIPILEDHPCLLDKFRKACRNR